MLATSRIVRRSCSFMARCHDVVTTILPLRDRPRSLTLPVFLVVGWPVVLIKNPVGKKSDAVCSLSRGHSFLGTAFFRAFFGPSCPSLAFLPVCTFKPTDHLLGVG